MSRFSDIFGKLSDKWGMVCGNSLAMHIVSSTYERNTTEGGGWGNQHTFNISLINCKFNVDHTKKKRILSDVKDALRKHRALTWSLLLPPHEYL